MLLRGAYAERLMKCVGRLFSQEQLHGAESDCQKQISLEDEDAGFAYQSIPEANKIGEEWRSIRKRLENT